MKIDLIIGSLRSGGAERVVCNLANYFATQGHIVRIITFMDKPDKYPLHDAIERIRFHDSWGPFNRVPIKGFFHLLKFYRDRNNRPDVISTHINMVAYASIIPAKIYGIKHVVSEHFNHKTRKVTLTKWILWNILYPITDAITVLTKFDLDFFKKKNPFTWVMYNPSSFEIADVEDKIPRSKYILAVGNVNRYEHKGFDTLIEIANSVLPNHPEWKLLIVGDGQDGISYLQNKYTVCEQVKFTGFRSDVNQLMKKSEIFVLPSRHEGLPMVLIEAMSQGMACIAFDCISGPSEIIDHNINGLLIENQNMAELAAALENLISDSSVRQNLRVNAIKSLDHFSIDEVGAKWLLLFEKLLTNA